MSINHEIDGIPEMYFHSYVAGATINTIKYWVLDPHRISVEELTHHIYKIVLMDHYVSWLNINIKRTMLKLDA